MDKTLSLPTRVPLVCPTRTGTSHVHRSEPECDPPGGQEAQGEGSDKDSKTWFLEVRSSMDESDLTLLFHLYHLKGSSARIEPLRKEEGRTQVAPTRRTETPTFFLGRVLCPRGGEGPTTSDRSLSVRKLSEIYSKREGDSS